MAQQRKGKVKQPKDSSGSLSSTNEETYRESRSRKSDKEKDHVKHPGSVSKSKGKPAGVISTTSSIYSILAAAAVSVVVYFVYQGYLETRVNTPLSEPKVVVDTGLAVPELYWGTYRPGSYLGLRTRDPASLIAGLMWLIPSQVRQGHIGLRHNCDQGDNLDSYGWLQHDGQTFGVQQILDGFVELETAFVKQPGGDHGGDWTARITAKPRVPKLEGEEVALYFYVALDENTEGDLRPVYSSDSSLRTKVLTKVNGYLNSLGNFSVSFHTESDRVAHKAYLSTIVPGPSVLKDAVLHNLRLYERGQERHISLPGSMGRESQPNFVVYQVTGKIPFHLDVVFESASHTARARSLKGAYFDDLLLERRQSFEKRFEETFHLSEKNFSAKEIRFAQAALSNMLGGIGYFHGSSRVQSVYNKNPVPYGPHALFSAVPSRSFFPRGFLWDEGFHNLMIYRWDPNLTLDIIAHWFDIMNVEGWIPREQILGSEARARVPEEFVTQWNTHANPPTLLLPLQLLISDVEKHGLGDQERQFLTRLWPRLVTWYNWFNQSQVGTTYGTYHWRGRDATAIRELNPKTLSSGLDDYPRATHPTVDERHVDLRVWLTIAAQVMTRVAQFIGRDDTKYRQVYEYLSDPVELDKLHWSAAKERYADYGLHTSRVVLIHPEPTPEQVRKHQKPDMIRHVVIEPEMGFVDDSFGYVGLFPLIAHLIPPDSPKLLAVLKDIRKPNLLWTPYGLRSLSKDSPLYMKRNTEHDPPYWRGPIWININYLVLRALHYYAKVEGPQQSRAQVLYNELRENLIGNIMKEYYRTGYIWEQYNDSTGEGQGCRPFTGWSALVVLIMSEFY